MATSGKWREEQILIICPGSRTTMAQLGCNELTLPTHRIPTRMFKDEDLWAPYYKTKRVKTVNGVDVEEWVEDVDEDEGAVYPIQGGRIVNMEVLLAFLDHVHSLLTTTYHNTPIMLMASPQWTRPDCETIARYIFENTRTPALCIIHSGIATQYGLKWPNMTVVDIGYEKVDVTAIHDGRVVNHMDLGAPGPEREISGGQVFTNNLQKLLAGKGFNHDMAEQLKKSAICEVLPYVGTAASLMELPAGNFSASATGPSTDGTAGTEAAKVGETNDGNGENGDDDGVLDVASIVTSGQTKEFLAKKEKEKENQKEKGKGGRKGKGDKDDAGAKPARLPNAKRPHNVFFYEEIIQEEVAPTSKEPEQKPTNGVSETATQGGESNATNGVSTEAPKPVEGQAQPAPETQTETKPEEPKPEEPKTEEPQPEDKPLEQKIEETKLEDPKPVEPSIEKPVETPLAVAPTTEPVPAPAPAPAPAPTTTTTTTTADTANEPLERRPKRVRRDIEVGLERFTFAERNQIDRIVNTIYRTIQGVDDMYMRPACWDNLVFVGNGARLRGLRENILQTLNARHLVSPSTATMFTSELPSNMATPTGTGSQTPTGSFTGAPHQLSTSGVNPLLQAATTAGFGGNVATPQAGSEAGGPAVGHHFHSQTPTSIKMAVLPTYLSEWSKNGFEEAMFLGAQVAARIAFCLHSNMDASSLDAQKLMSLSRVEYNELGPKGIRTHSMLG